ncbi:MULTISPECIES: LLM class flavin-dependent oxidoreductase [unclassified Micrococcus]|uniref:LLM class flavin-dependent oxidoreductase n=1 Tax=unclassified Micrococcus TaxID=2620948 RepID=UPI0008A36258|nr:MULTISPECIES: LLM class flavin-dependent oxidoreductase [unclassified Micrococcus]OFR90177.1 alkane 1-monooxygenase [Micrococcus sp. HMSC067E09]PNL18160.1 LLM class flavin-dependent oxidoreductase [Micrococcus sp. FDAARGOS_333]
MTALPISMLDLATVKPGRTVAEALSESVQLTQAAEEQGFTRVWFAEHHNMPGIASSATAVLLAHVATQTSTIRLGSGGVMLPNHSPLVIAEQFGTLAELHPGRIDLGLGRAPGTDQRTLQALRRSPDAAEDFPQDVLELQGYLRGESRLHGVDAYPGKGTDVPLHILGSSAFGAQLAARLGLPYAFASHFAPDMLEHAARIYRETFQPSEQLAEPHFMAAMNVVAADTEEQARAEYEHALRLRVQMLVGRGRDYTDQELDLLMDSPAAAQVIRMVRHTAVGTGEQAAAHVRDFAAQSGADEVMVTAMAPSLTVRRRTVELLGEHVVRG